MKVSRSAFPLAALVACCVSTAGAQQPAKPDFDHRSLIASSLDRLFSAEAKVRGVAISELRTVQSPVGLTWAACVRIGAATSISGSQTLPRIYVVTFTLRHQIAERRPAAAKDCAGAQFEPLK
jgi:hypothetical protein